MLEEDHKAVSMPHGHKFSHCVPKWSKVWEPNHNNPITKLYLLLLFISKPIWAWQSLKFLDSIGILAWIH